ncbi:MAG: hypothetical protein ABL930_03320 [Pseudobdellovibrio sp.]
MSYLGIISQVLLYGFAIGFSFWLMRYAIAAYVFSRRKEEINKLNARLSVLKMHLRGKIKRKCNKIESVLKKDAETFAALTPNLNKIISLTFNTPAEYQVLVTNLHEITVKINEYINFKHRNLMRDNLEKPESKQALTQEEEAQEKCAQLVKYDKAHMIIIVEVVQTTNELRSKIHEYNELTEFEKGHKKISFTPEPVEIEHFELINSLVEIAKVTPDQSPDFPILEKSLFDDVA